MVDILSMPPHAMLRNLGNMAKAGLLMPYSDSASLVLSRLSDNAALKKGRVHPLHLLIAQRVYGYGHGLLGGGQWKVNQLLVQALESAFYDSFTYAEPSGKRILLALDVSGSMSIRFAKYPIRLCEATAVLAMAAIRQESEALIYGFADTLRELGINRNDTLEAAARKALDQNWGRTDCAQPAVWAARNMIPLDLIGVLTDNKSWTGEEHVTTALQKLRAAVNRPVRQIVVGMTATDVSVADPQDPLQLDVAGFSPELPQVLSQFAA